MTVTLIEGAIVAIDTYIQENIEAKLISLNTEYADDITLEEPKAYYLGNVPDVIPETTSICYQGDGWTPKDQTAFYLHVTSQINIHIFVGDADLTVRFKKLARYARAIIELLNTGESSYGYTHFISGKVQFSNTLSGDSFLQAVTIPLSVEKAENY